jgi:hypothetical protein
MAEHLRLAQDKVAGIVIDDVRFPNEGNLVQGMHGLLVRIEPYPGYTPQSNHVSETAMDGYKAFMLTLRPAFGEEHLRRAAEDVIKAAKKCRLL